MYNQMPPRHRKRYRIVLTLGWLFATMGGISTLVFEPIVLAVVEDNLRHLAGLGLAVTAASAAVGVIVNRYRIEWVSAWFAAALVAPLTGVYWWTAITSNSGRFPVTFMLTSLICFFVLRALACSAYAEVLRDLHRMEKKVHDQ